MRPYIRIAFFTLSIYCLTSCTRPPNIKVISEDLGISIPKKHKIVNADHDPLGPGGDQDITYTFKFDSVSFIELIKNVENSVLFNTTSQKDFKTLAADRKMDIIKILAQNKMTSYWIRSGSEYKYSGNELFFNDNDKTSMKAAELGIFLPNYDKERTFPDGDPFPNYHVNAIIDRKNLTLYYRYVHP